MRNSFFPRGLAKEEEHCEPTVEARDNEQQSRYRFRGVTRPLGIRQSDYSDAKPITEAEKRHCEQAYHKYCAEYGLESNALRNCMSRNGRALPHACIEALIDAGEISRSEVERRKKSGK